MWVTIYFGRHEVINILLCKYSKFLYKERLSWFIDDMLGIWIYHECGHWRNCHHWKDFCSDLNNNGILKWTIAIDHAYKTQVFLYLTICIEGSYSHIVTRTYQKPMNLYFPGSSAHPCNMIKGVSYGLLYATIWSKTPATPTTSDCKEAKPPYP